MRDPFLAHLQSMSDHQVIELARDTNPGGTQIQSWTIALDLASRLDRALDRIALMEPAYDEAVGAAAARRCVAHDEDGWAFHSVTPGGNPC